MTTLEKFAELVRMNRARLRLSQRALAESVGIHKNTLQKIETGTYSPNLITFFRLAVSLQFTCHEFDELMSMSEERVK